jgi:predicted transcriptional regulator
VDGNRFRKRVLQRNLGEIREQTEPNVSKSLPVSVRLAPNLNKQVADIAAAVNRPRSWVIEQAIREFVAVQAWQLAAIDEGIRDADTGRVVSHDDVTAWVRSWVKPDELPMPLCG